MRSLPVVAGVLVLSFGLVVFMSTFRPTRMHLFVDARGDSFSIEIPRGWSVDGDKRPFTQHLNGPLPSGGRGSILLSTIHGWGNLADRPLTPGEELRETWEAEGGRYTCVWPLKAGLRWCRLVQDHLEFAALAENSGPLSPDDAEVIDPSLRSIRRVGK